MKDFLQYLLENIVDNTDAIDIQDLQKRGPQNRIEELAL